MRQIRRQDAAGSAFTCIYVVDPGMVKLKLSMMEVRVAAPRRRPTLAAARRASGHTQESLAAALRVDRSTVGRWEAGERTPAPHLQPKLARLLGQSQQELRSLVTYDGSVPDASIGLDHSKIVGIVDALDWLDEHAGWRPGTSKRAVEARLLELGPHTRRAKISRSQMVGALRSYYPDSTPYQVNRAGHNIATSVVSQPAWLDLRCPLSSDTDRLTLVRSTLDDETGLDEVCVRRATDRLVDAADHDVRIANAPIYQLSSLDTSGGVLRGTLGLTPFARYALTLDLLETELIDALSAGAECRPGTLPLRDRYLPDLRSVFDIGNRRCVGGTLALCAVARPRDRYRGKPDYALVVQERSSLVLNAACQISVIPKGFHQPMTDVRSDARIGATLLRELEEELFGRRDVDNTVSQYRTAAPMHPSRLSAPMQWLQAEPGRLRMECTGFGLNLVSGNYEFASLVVIEDEGFWSRFGGDIEANWESSGLRLYSSLDTSTLAELIEHEAWSSEGLFAMLQGIRRLAETGGRRVDLPAIDHASVDI